jgi:Tfp pilus assembly protein FimV
MKYKELVLRRLESMEGKLKRMRNALNERNVEAAREILNEVLELRDDTQSIIERENNN